MSPKEKPLATVPANADKKAREQAIAEAAKKKATTAKPAPKPEAPKPAEKPKKEAPKKPAEKPDEDMLSVSDIAKACGVDPKRARAKLRALGQSATEGRWPKVKRGSKRHQELVDLLTPSETEEVEEDEEDESTGSDEESGEEEEDEE